MSVSELLWRIGITFFMLLILTRIMGRKEISQMTFFNFVSAISIGTIAGSVVVNSSINFRNGLITLVSWTGITLLLGYIDIKSKKARKLIEGDPLIVIRNGKILEKAMKKARLDLDALNVKLREKNVFAVAEVDYAIFEIDGKLSVMKKTAQQPATKNDINMTSLTPSVVSIPTEVISDGNVNQNNLEKLNLNQGWLMQQLELAGVESINDVFYAEVQKDGSVYFDTYSDKLH
ncbi:DUF421 domain-containing protein [Bacillus sp. HMF5848]|nr:DUF421 domain-containing protein [Bacillus sp. HMF5848]